MTNNLTRETVKAWLDLNRQELDRVRSQMQPLLKERMRLEERESLLQSLLESFNSESGDLVDEAKSPKPQSTGELVVQRVTEILTEAGAPLHINDIYARYREKGYEVPGAGKAVNLTTHIRRSEEITSPSRGVYALRGQQDYDGTMGEKKRTTRRKTRRRN